MADFKNSIIGIVLLGIFSSLVAALIWDDRAIILRYMAAHIGPSVAKAQPVDPTPIAPGSSPGTDPHPADTSGTPAGQPGSNPPTSSPQSSPDGASPNSPPGTSTPGQPARSDSPSPTDAPGSNSASEDRKADLDANLTAAIGGFESYKQGAPTFQFGNRVWISRKKPFSADSCRITEADSNVLTCFFPQADKPAADSYYQELSRDIQSSLPSGWTRTAVAPLPDQPQAVIFNSDNGMRADVWISLDLQSGKYEVMYSFAAKPEAYSATHESSGGGCPGTLVLTPGNMRFYCRGKQTDELIVWKNAVKGTDRNGIELLSGKKYHFKILGYSKEDVSTLFRNWMARGQ
jgi:hypothetical protein